MSIKSKKTLFYLYGCFGFFGFTFLRYFASHNIIDLSGIAFFGFFGYFLLAGIYTDEHDERYFENVKNAKAFTANVAIGEIAVLFAVLVLFVKDLNFIIVLLALCLSSSVLTFSIKLYLLEKN